MAYRQTNNPLSRKTSPLRSHLPGHIDPNDNTPASSQTLDELPKMDTTMGGTMPQDTSIEPNDYDYEGGPRIAKKKKKKEIIPVGPR